MKIGFVLDPLESLKIYKDTSYAMMREAAARGHGHEAFHRLESIHASIIGDRPELLTFLSKIKRLS